MTEEKEGMEKKRKRWKTREEETKKQGKINWRRTVRKRRKRERGADRQENIAKRMERKRKRRKYRKRKK